MAAPQEAKLQGLLLTLPGAPDSPHTVPGMIGWYWPSAPTPVGGPGEPRAEKAIAADRDQSKHLKLVSMSKSDVERRRKQIAEFRSGFKKATKNFRPATSDEAERKRAELMSAAGKED